VTHKRKIPTFFWEYPGHKPPPPDLEGYRLEVQGLVAQPLVLELEGLGRLLPFREVRRRFYCVNGWTMEDDWGGYRLAELLEVVGPRAAYLRATSLGGYEDTTRIDALLRGDAMLVTHMGGRPLDPKRGSPLRLMLFDMYQFKGVKAVATLEVTPEYRPGTWQAVGYRDATIQPYPHLDITTGARLMPDPALFPGRTDEET
jgi:DMSO/TMAO reductase YedYZ molybdopterin-dependent catalytic subunit